MADASGTTVWKWEQVEPFGSATPNEDPDNNSVSFDFPLRDEGTYADKETNLVYNWNRYRDVGFGRFIQPDPLGLDGDDLSLYVLNKNNPLSFIDPSGLMGQGSGANAAKSVWPPGKGPNSANCPPDDCRNPVTMSFAGVCRPDDVMCGQAMAAAGIQGSYYPQTKTYSLDCLITFGLGVKATGSIGTTIVLKRAAAAGVRGAATAAAVANNPVSMVVSAAYAADAVFQHCECKPK